MSDENKKIENTNDADDILKILDNYEKSLEKERSENHKAQTEEIIVPKQKLNSHFTDVFDAINPQEVKITEPMMSSHFTSVDSEETITVEEPPKQEDELIPIPKEIKKRKKRRKRRRSSGSSTIGVFFSSIFKSVMYIVFVLAAAAYMSYFIINVGNDVFAFVKSERQVEFEVNELMTSNDVAQSLVDKGIIKYKGVFKLYAKYKNHNKPYLVGDYILSPNMNYDEILTKLTTVPYIREVVRITIPEGFTTDQIINLFLQNGIGEREKFVDVINNYPFKHDFLKVLNETPISEDRTYRLDGYLFPNTYDFYVDEDEVHVINKLLNSFESNFVSVYYKRCENLGMSMDEIITLASMVQAEAKYAIDLEYISSVFHNRLNSSSFKYLESDATVVYCLEERKEELTQSDLNIKSPYNTYVSEGLPPGAICNPGIDAIEAALYPDDPLNSKGESYSAFFFVSNKFGKTYYAATNKQHDKNKKQVAEDNKQYIAQLPEESIDD